MPQLADIYATQYAQNVYTMAQQQGSLLYSHVTHIDMKGEKRTIERAKPTSAVAITTTAGKTPIVATEFDRRVLTANAYHWGDLIDWTEDQGMGPIVDPTGPITTAGAYAMGRCLDEIIVRKALNGPAYTGKEGTTVVALPSAQKIAVNFGGSDSGLTLDKLLKARSILGKSLIPMKAPGQEVIMVITQSQLDDLLKITQVQSADYNTVRALVSGEVDTFMGFRFIIVDAPILPLADGSDSDSDSSTSGSNVRCCYAFLKSNVVLAEPQPITTTINTRPDLCNSWQVYAKMKAGATRYQEEGVVKIMCKE